MQSGNGYQQFEVSCYHHLNDGIAGKKLIVTKFQCRKQKQYFLPKLWYLCIKLHGIRRQQTAILTLSFHAMYSQLSSAPLRQPQVSASLCNTYLLKASRRKSSQEIIRIKKRIKVPCVMQKSPKRYVLCHVNPVLTFLTCFLKMHLSIILTSILQWLIQKSEPISQTVLSRRAALFHL
jgi:hypothetical protein